MTTRHAERSGSVGTDHRPLRDVVCDVIRDRITAGEYPPSYRLIEDRLADDLGVSRNPVREALRVLAIEGYVTLVPRRGAFVATLSPQEVEEIFEVRTVLEALAARRAAKHASASDREQLEHVLAESARACAHGAMQELPALNTRFHELVLAIAGNGLLTDMMVPLRGRMQWIFSRTVTTRAHDSVAEHQALAEAIMAGDGDRAAALAAAHVQEAHHTYHDVLGTDLRL
jgi:DNA-binding GntR family transcriptional regulator